MTTVALARTGRGETALVALLLGLAGAAWALTYNRMESMDAGAATDLGDLGWFAVTWALMMAAMMLPALTPMVAAYRRRGRCPSAARRRGRAANDGPGTPLVPGIGAGSPPWVR